MAVHAQLRGGLASLWASTNPVCASREPCYETDTGKLKFGDGVTHYNDLPYFVGSVSASIAAAIEALGLGTAATHAATDFATPSDVSTAQSNAVATAASDATTKANTAQTNATAAAATDATAKVSAEATIRTNADALLIPLTQKGAASGVATLDSSGLVPAAQMPALAIGVPNVVASQAAMLALTAQRGDVAIRTDLSPNESFMLAADDPTTLGNWKQITADSATLGLAKSYTDTETTRASTAEGTLTTALAAEVTNRGTAVTAEATTARAAEGVLAARQSTTVASVVTGSSTLLANRHNPVDCTSGSLSFALPTGQAAGTPLSVERVDLASANSCTVTGSIRGVGSSSLTLLAPSSTTASHESVMLIADSAGSWWPVAGHKTKSWLDSTYVGKGSQVLNAVDFGADPTGTVSSTTAFTNCQAALTTGGTMVVPPGNYTGQLAVTANVPLLVLSSGANLTGPTGAVVGTGLTATAATDTLTATAHGLTTGQVVKISSISTSNGLTTTDPYFVTQPTTNTFKLQNIITEAVMDITADSTVTVTLGSPTVSINTGVTGASAQLITVLGLHVKGNPDLTSDGVLIKDTSNVRIDDMYIERTANTIRIWNDTGSGSEGNVIGAHVFGKNSANGLVFQRTPSTGNASFDQTKVDGLGISSVTTGLVTPAGGLFYRARLNVLVWVGLTASTNGVAFAVNSDMSQASGTWSAELAFDATSGIGLQPGPSATGWDLADIQLAVRPSLNPITDFTNMTTGQQISYWQGANRFSQSKGSATAILFGQMQQGDTYPRVTQIIGSPSNAPLPGGTTGAIALGAGGASVPDVAFLRKTANVGQMAKSNMFYTGHDVTGSRPSGTILGTNVGGALFFDDSIIRQIISDGTSVWRVLEELKIASQTLASAGAVTITANAGSTAAITLQANASSSTITGGFAGQILKITLIQDATGSRTFVWPTTCKFAGGTAPTLATTAAYRDTVTFEFDGTNWYEISRALAVH